MTAVTEPRAARHSFPRVGDGLIMLAMVLGATALTCLMNAALFGATMGGRLGDPDDAMRLVEARAWLAGQSWFDMTARGLDPPLGSFMHWSRLVDLPVAAMIKLFGPFTDGASAERFAMVAVPTLWLVALYYGIARLATLLVGRRGRVLALTGMVLSGATLVQFGPGRIGHHAPETVGLVFAVGSALAAFDPRRVREAFVAGCLVALSLAMSLETLPFHAVLIGVLTALWVWQGSKLAAMLAWFAGGLVVALPVTFLLTVDPQRWLAPVCDAYGAAHLGAGLIAVSCLLLVASRTRHLQTPARRLAAAAIPAILAGAYVAAAYPECLHSPFAGVDPLVRELWLDHVGESLSLVAFLGKHPAIGMAIVCPVALGIAGNIVAAASKAGTDRLRYVVVAVLSAFGLALAFWQVRVLGSVTPLALCGGVYLVTVLYERLASRMSASAAALAYAAILPFTSTAWALALPSEPSPRTEGTAACLSPAALAPLAQLPAATAVAPINSGAHLLEATKLSVFAAPYHRNNDGNLFAFETLMAAPDKARAMITARHVTYVIICPGMADFDRLVQRAPDGLAAQLGQGHVPGFLAERPLNATPYKVYEVKRQSP